MSHASQSTPVTDSSDQFLQALDKASIGKSCVRFERLADVDIDVLRELIAASGRSRPAGAITA